MKHQTLDEKHNALLKRKEILIKLDYEGKATPSKEQIKEIIAKEFNSPVENIEVSKILSEIGRTAGKAWIKIWEHKAPEKKVKKEVKK